MRVVFVHGWSVTNTDTYGGLPAALAKRAPDALKVTVSHLYLAKYVSFADEVKMDDLVRGMDHAVRQEILPQLAAGEKFACVTHSTGGPVVRAWLDHFHRANLAASRLGHLVMLAPANHGSALAQLGKGRLSRLKSFVVEGVEPGTGILDWLELGSEQSWDLNRAWLACDCVAAGLYPFVLTGQRIDRAFYDNLNSYTGEEGSDGVVRVAAANLNYGLLRLTQVDGGFAPPDKTHTRPTAFGVLPGRAHSGDKIGILRSVRADNKGRHPTLRWLLACLQVATPADYAVVADDLARVTAQTQRDEHLEKVKTGFLFERTFETNRYCMLVFRLRDDRGHTLSDYEILFTAGPNYDPNHLPEGFFVDRQRNSVHPGKLTYYIDYDVMCDWFAKPKLKDCFGLRVVARPQDGYAYYTIAEHRGTFSELGQFLAPNQTLMVEIELQRHVREGVFRLTQKLAPESFSRQPKGRDLPRQQ